tara:strand:- start:7769 stop:8410 length:642 start_codon:yes stop_codon:yes gene_type:complete
VNIEHIDIKKISNDPANVRRHDDKNLSAIKASLRRFGQQKPIVIDGKGVVVAGNGTLEAAVALGWTKIQAVRTELVGSEATAYAIADNRTAELADWDHEALVQQLGALNTEDFALVDAAGFDKEELELMLDQFDGEATENDPFQEWVGMPEFHNDKHVVRKIVVNFATHDDVDAFFELIDQECTEKTKSIYYPYKPKGDWVSKRFEDDSDEKE